jgi:hypothetical protein
MSISTCINARAYRDSYERLDQCIHANRTSDSFGVKADVDHLIEVKAAVDAAWEKAVEAIRGLGFQADVSDGAEELVGNLYRYLLISNPALEFVVPS